MSPREITGLSHADALLELLRLHGYSEIPKKGFMHITCSLGAAEMMVEAEFEPGENGGRDSPSWAESITLTGVFINGTWIGIDSFTADVTGAWHEAAVKRLQELRDESQS